MSELTVYKKDHIITDTKTLTENHKDYIVMAMNRQNVVPEYKIKNFIGNAQYTPYAKVKQYLLELNTREAAVEQMEYEVEKINLQIEYEHEMAAAEESPAKKKLHMLEVQKFEQMKLKSLSRLRDAYHERASYLKLIDEFNNSPEGYLPDGKRIIDYVDDPVISEELERQHWSVRLARQTAMDMVAYGRAGVGNMEAVYMLEPDQQVEVMQLACELFVKNEHRTNSILSYVNEKVQLEYRQEEEKKLAFEQQKQLESVK
jgi:hypothetical protein